jgi:hypothetical protein
MPFKFKEKAPPREGNRTSLFGPIEIKSNKTEYKPFTPPQHSNFSGDIDSLASDFKESPNKWRDQDGEEEKSYKGNLYGKDQEYVHRDKEKEDSKKDEEAKEEKLKSRVQPDDPEYTDVPKRPPNIQQSSDKRKSVKERMPPPVTEAKGIDATQPQTEDMRERNSSQNSQSPSKGILKKKVNDDDSSPEKSTSRNKKQKGVEFKEDLVEFENKSRNKSNPGSSATSADKLDKKRRNTGYPQDPSLSKSLVENVDKTKIKKSNTQISRGQPPSSNEMTKSHAQVYESNEVINIPVKIFGSLEKIQNSEEES